MLDAAPQDVLIGGETVVTDPDVEGDEVGNETEFRNSNNEGDPGQDSVGIYNMG